MRRFYYFICLFILVIGANVNAFGATGYAKVIANSSPANGGFVYVGAGTNGNILDAAEMTSSAESSKDFGRNGWTQITTGDIAFRLCASASEGYTFRGWQKNGESNIISTNSIYDVNVTGGPGSNIGSWLNPSYVAAASYTYTYNAIFAQMVADEEVEELAFGQILKNHSKTLSIDVTHVHAGTITAAISGDDAGVLSVSKNASISSNQDKTTTTIEVTYTPTTSETEVDAELVITSNNGLSELRIPVSGYCPPQLTPSFSIEKEEFELDETVAFTFSVFTNPQVTIANENIVSYDAINHTLTGMALGSTTVTLTQEETDEVLAAEKEFTVTITKKTSSLSVLLNDSARASITITQAESVNVAVVAQTNSDGIIIIEQLGGKDIASYSNGVISTSWGTGTATFRAIVAETDTYKTATHEFSITIEKQTTHLPISMSQALFNNSNIKVDATTEVRGGILNGTVYQSAPTWENTNGIVLANSAHLDGRSWDDNYVILHFEGVPDSLKFDIAVNAEGNLGASQVFWYVQESPTSTMPDDTTWSGTHDKTAFLENISVQLKKNTRYVKLCYSGNMTGYFRNVSISELKYVEDPSLSEVNLGTAAINVGEVSKSVNVNWCNIAPLTVSCDNPRFTVSPSVFGGFENYSSQEIIVSYTHGVEIGAQDADITISNGNPAYTKTIHVTAETTKRPQAIVWNSELEATGFVMNVGERYPQAANQYVATTARNGAHVTFVSANPEVIRVEEDTILVAVAASDDPVKIIALETGDDEYSEAKDSADFVVTNKQKQTIEWDQNKLLLGLLTTDSEKPITLTATVTSDGEIEYVSADENVVRIDGNQLIVVGEGHTYITATQTGGVIKGVDYFPISKRMPVIVRDPAEQCNMPALSVSDEITLSADSLIKGLELDGTPDTLTFYALHGTKSSGIFDRPVYAPLIVEQYAKIENIWGWYSVYNVVVNTTATYSEPIVLDESATHIRFRTTETGTTHTISGVNVTRKKYMRTDVESIDLDIESNAIWSKDITISHSNIDLMTVDSKKGLLTLSSSTLGEGCGDFGDDVLTVSFTPMDKYKEYVDTIVISDGKADPSTIIIPVRLYSRGLNQLINTFNLPEACVATDTVNVSATASSELEVTFISSDSTIAYVNNGQLVILSSGTVSITARQEGNEKYDAAEQTKTIVISKAETSVITAPTASEITYGEALSASELANGVGSVEGTFAWADGTQVLNAGAHTEIVIFTPTDTDRYSTSTIEVEVIVAKAASSAEAPMAAENLVYNGEAQTLVVAGTANGGEMQYSLDGENWSTELPQATDAGAYAVYYKVAGDANHNDFVAEEPLTVVIDYMIAYELNGGNVETANPTHYNAETETFTLVNPTKEHYTFAGWTGSNGEEPQTEVTIAQGTTGNLSYVANWTFIKQNQTIVWEQELGTVEVEDNTLQMQAEASSWLNIYYTSSDSTIAYVDVENYVVALKAGEVTITAHQDGNETYKAAEPVSKTLTVVDKENQGGNDATAVEDVNGDKANGEWTKVLRNNQIFIIRGSKTYTVQGQRVE